MRIISGTHRGRQLDRVGKKTTRETADMVREAVFQMIPIDSESVVLDLFAGSGAYALEAISRGAKFAYLSDHDKDAVKTIYKNVEKLNMQDQVNVKLNDYKQMLVKIKNTRFSHIFVDPPYAFNEHKKLFDQLSYMLKDNGYLIVETDKKTKLEETYNTLKFMKAKSYGIKKITIYQN